MHCKKEKVINLSLAGCLFVLFTIGCSRIPNRLGGEIFPRGREQMTRLEEVERFDLSGSRKRNDRNSIYLLACYYQEQDMHRESIGEFRKILLSDPGNVKALNGMGISYDMLGDFRGAMESYERALKLKEDLDYVHNNRGYSYLLQGNPDEAILSFQRAIALNSRNSQFHNNLGLAYASKGQMNLAMLEFKLAGIEGRAYYNIARINSRRKSYEEGQHHDTEVLAASCSVTQAHDSLEAFEPVANLSQEETPEAEYGDLALLSQLDLGESEIKEKILDARQAVMKSSSEEPSEMRTHLAGSTPEECYESGEMNNKEEVFRRRQEAGIKREVPPIDYVIWIKKPIGQRALELSNTKSDWKILEILRKEYGEEQLYQWLGISMEKDR